MGMEKDSFFSNYIWEIIFIMAIGVFWRLIPHIPNLTPFVALSLFAGRYLPRKMSFLFVLMALFISDLGLALILGYPIVSYYTIFSYTGFLAVILLGPCLSTGSKWRFPACFVGGGVGFWLWTNLGVWLVNSFYSRTIEGLGLCYYMALPFLRNELIGDLIWGAIIFGIFHFLLKRKKTDEKSVRCVKIY